MALQAPQNMLAVALAMAKAGFRVFPVTHGCKFPPHTVNWPAVATTNIKTILEWWTRWPFANVAICCGGKTSLDDGKGPWLVVIDFDCRNGKVGMIAYNEWLERGWLETMRVITASGGRHAYFWSDVFIRGSIGIIAKDCDIKAHRGYVLAAGSKLIMPDGSEQVYSWESISRPDPSRIPEKLKEMALAAMSKAIIAGPTNNVIQLDAALMDSEAAIRRAIAYLINEAPEAHQGRKGDITTFGVAQRVRAFAISEEKCFELMLHHWNEEKAFPRWSPEDLRQKIHNAYKYAERAPAPGSATPEIQIETSGFKLETKEEQAKAEEPKPEPETVEEETPKPLFNFHPIRQWKTKPNPQSAIAHQLAPRRHVVDLYAGTAAGKTTLALQLIQCHAMGIPWLGFEVEQGPVFMLSAEDDGTVMQLRNMLIAQHYGHTMDQLADAGFHIVNCDKLDGIPMMAYCTNEKSERLEQTIIYKRALEFAHDVKPICMVIDPLSLVFAGSELSRIQAYAFIDLLRQLAKASGGYVLLLAHPSITGEETGRGASGSTAWTAACRAHWYLVKELTEAGLDTGGRQLRFIKTQYGKVPAPVDLIYRNGLYIPTTEIQREEQARMTRELFVNVLARFNREQRYLTNQPRTRNYAPRLMAEDPEVKAAHVKVQGLETAMHELLAAGKIRVAEYRDGSRRWRERLEVVEEASEGLLA